MRVSFYLITVLFLAGCQSETPPASEPDLVEPVTFSTWPSVTAKPVQVTVGFDADCLGPTPEEVRAMKRHGPHVNYSIVVRVSPEAIATYHEGKALPTGAVVVKEKYAYWDASGPLSGYAVMVKREPGYFPEGGDWEYEYVSLVPERKETRGRLANCAACHASAKERDYLFRSYGSAGR
jgi:hypothetical protein